LVSGEIPFNGEKTTEIIRAGNTFILINEFLVEIGKYSLSGP